MGTDRSGVQAMRAFLSQQELLRPERKRKTIAAETLAASLHRLLCKADGLPSSMSWNLISRPHLSLSLSVSLAAYLVTGSVCTVGTPAGCLAVQNRAGGFAFTSVQSCWKNGGGQIC